MKDDLAGLTTFLAVAEKRSFTAAAAELGVTASAVSQTVQNFEERLGLRLFHRTTRRVGLTEAGQRLHDRVRPAYSDMLSAVESLNELRDRPAGTLRLTISRAAAAVVIEPVLPAFVAEYPEIRLDISVHDRLADIVGEGFDAGVRLGETLAEGMVAVRISRDQRSAIVGSPAYFASRGKPRHPRDLHAHENIGYRRATGRDVYKWEFDENGKEFEMELESRVVVDEVMLAIRAAEAGLGLCYVLEDHVRAELQRGTLVRVLSDFCSPFPGFFLYYPSRVQVPPKLRALIEFLRYPRKRHKL